MLMLFSDIKPFVRYVHYIPMDFDSEYGDTIAYDNRLFFVFGGNGEISVNERIYTIAAGTVVIIPSGTKYRLLPSAAGLTYIAVNFDYTSKNSDKTIPIPPADVASYNPLLRLEMPYFEDFLTFNEAVRIENMFYLNGILSDIYNEYTRKVIFFENITSELFSEVLFRCARTVHTSEISGSCKKINQIIDYIDENYGKKLTNKQIGDRFNLHPNYINSLFKGFTGMSLHRFVLQKRLSVAVKLLMQKNCSIAEISEKCGFSDIYHFSRSFKEATGVPPSKYCK